MREQLLEAARAIFEGKAEFQGGKVDDHLKRLAKKGYKPAILALKRPKKTPPELAHVLAWYQELRARNGHGMRIEPVPMSEIVAYSTAYKLDLEPWEVDTLCRLDHVWLDCHSPTS